MSSVDTILQQVDMESTRTPSALCEWVVSKASALSETDEGKRFARSGATLPKKLWEEIRPLGLFAFRRYGLRKDVKCTPNLNNENYDGRIDFDDISVPSIYVEITYAKDGYDESLRLEVLSAIGSVNRSGRISISGTKASGHRKVDVENEFVDRQETRGHALEIVRERIVNKSDKVYGPNHVLVVVIDDYLPFRTEGDRMILVEYAKSVIDNVKLDFGEIVLLGSSGNYLCTI
ncbi:MAG: hypothetical protein HY281_12735 [Nitrospirae bacterium]|nr:hypothetical protein [Nitrospirota bacterium]